MLMVFVNDIHSRPPCLNSNLEETLDTLDVFVFDRYFNKWKLPLTNSCYLDYLIEIRRILFGSLNLF